MVLGKTNLNETRFQTKKLLLEMKFGGGGIDGGMTTAAMVVEASDGVSA